MLLLLDAVSPHRVKLQLDTLPCRQAPTKHFFFLAFQIFAVADCQGQRAHHCWPKYTKKSAFSHKYENEVIVHRLFFSHHTISSRQSHVSCARLSFNHISGWSTKACQISFAPSSTHLSIGHQWWDLTSSLPLPFLPGSSPLLLWRNSAWSPGKDSRS